MAAVPSASPVSPGAAGTAACRGRLTREGGEGFTSRLTSSAGGGASTAGALTGAGGGATAASGRVGPVAGRDAGACA